MFTHDLIIVALYFQPSSTRRKRVAYSGVEEVGGVGLGLFMGREGVGLGLLVLGCFVLPKYTITMIKVLASSYDYMLYT